MVKGRIILRLLNDRENEKKRRLKKSFFGRSDRFTEFDRKTIIFRWTPAKSFFGRPDRFIDFDR